MRLALAVDLVAWAQAVAGFQAVDSRVDSQEEDSQEEERHLQRDQAVGLDPRARHRFLTLDRPRTAQALVRKRATHHPVARLNHSR